eukprot:5689-Alexandrium_andersonii.AAC.1
MCIRDSSGNDLLSAGMATRPSKEAAYGPGSPECAIHAPLRGKGEGGIEAVGLCLRDPSSELSGAPEGSE